MFSAAASNTIPAGSELFPYDYTAADQMDLDVGPGTSESGVLYLTVSLLVVDAIIHGDSACEPSTPPSEPLAQIAGLSEAPRTHEFTIEYHPNSRRAPEMQQLPNEHCSKRERFSPPNMELWRPFFKTRDDFMFVELLLEVGMTNDQSDRLIKLIKRCLDGEGSLTLTNHSDIRGAWECASAQLTAVSPDIILKLFTLTFQGLV